MSSKNNTYKYFVNGPISSEIIAQLVSDNQENHELGAQSIFLGQVRADKKHGLRVQSIHYSSYAEMAEKEIETIKKNVINKFGLSNINILHSIGEVKCGKISVLVLVSSPHREECFESLKYIVNEIKTKVPIWKKEIYDDGSYRWVK
jgi:molybdopterin synthase catalytic subunit